MGTAAGRLNTTLTTVYPYLRWGSGDTTLWAVAGAGRGTATLTRAAVSGRDASPLRLTLGLLEGRRRVATVGRRLRIGLRGEASLARLATAEGDATIDALHAGVQRLRGGIELTQDLDGPGGSALTPFGALSARHDGGAGLTGLGLEVAGGMRLRGGRFQVEAQGRRLVLHSATGYSDHGVSLAASVGAGAYQPGLTLMVRPTWGTAGMGADTLWQDHFQIPAQNTGFDEAGIDAQIGYGLRLGEGSLFEPFGGFGERAGLGRRLQLGARLGGLDQIPGLFGGPLQLELTGERYDRPSSPSDHRFSMVGVIKFGDDGSKPRWTARPAAATRPAPPAEAAVPMPTPETAPPAVHDLLEVPHELPMAVLAGQVQDAPPLEREPLTLAAGPPTLPPTTGTATPRRPPAPATAPARNDYRPNRGFEFEMPRGPRRSTPPTMADDQTETPPDDLAMAASANTPGPDGDPQQRGSGRAGFWFFWILVPLLLWTLRRLWNAFAANRATDPGPSGAGGNSV